MRSIYVRLSDSRSPECFVIVQGDVGLPIVETTIEDDEDNDDGGASTTSSQYIRAKIISEFDKKRIVSCSNVDLTSLLKNDCSILTTEISRNGRDFSSPAPQSLICHQFTVDSISSTAVPFAGLKEMVVNGLSILPSHDIHTEAVLSLIVDDPTVEPKLRKDDNTIDIVAAVRADNTNQLVFTCPPISDFFTGKYKMPNYNMFRVKVGFRICDGDTLASDCFLLQYYSMKPLTVVPEIMRFRGGTTLTISSPSFLFHSKSASVYFIDRESNNIQTISDIEFVPDTKNIFYKLVCKAPNMAVLDSPRDSSKAASNLEIPSNIFLGVALDGTTMPSDDDMFKLKTIDALHFNDLTIPKGGFPANSTITLSMKFLISSSICIVRLHGSDSKVYADTNGTVDETAQTITFSLPDVSSVPPVVSGKTNLYFVGISVDGSTFDFTKSPIIQIK
jgi:hypothetical protein